jgi:isopenicillin N synthase-like dioxygenase
VGLSSFSYRTSFTDGPYADFENRKQEIISQLVDAAENSGFLTLVDHGITVEEIEAQFALSKTFFGLPLETKHATKFDSSTSLGFEYKVGALLSTKRMIGSPSEESKTRHHWCRPEGVSLDPT